MDKEWMLKQVRSRYNQLNEWYKLACRQKNREGEDCTYGTAKEIRTECLRDMRILRMIELLLMHCPKGMFIDDEEAESGFDKLVNPVRRKKSKEYHQQ